MPENVPLNEIFASCIPQLRKTAERLTRNREDSEDVLQDALLFRLREYSSISVPRQVFHLDAHNTLQFRAVNVEKGAVPGPMSSSLDLEAEEEHLNFADD